MFICEQCFWLDGMAEEFLDACYMTSDDPDGYFFNVFTV